MVSGLCGKYTRAVVVSTILWWSMIFGLKEDLTLVVGGGVKFILWLALLETLTLLTRCVVVVVVVVVVVEVVVVVVV